MANGDVCKLNIDSVAPGGDALGRLEGKPVFIPGGAPEETVLCRITEDRNTWARAELLEIIKPSPVRVESICKYYGKCGGCNLQHIDYKTQLEIKTAILKDSFLRIGEFEPPEIEIFSSPPFGYRNRMQFHCLRQTAKGNDYGFGLKEKGTDKIIPVLDCPIAVPEINEILNKGGKGISLPPEKDRFTVFAKDDVFLNEGGQQRGIIKLLNKEIKVDAGLFFQSNCSMLEKLVLELQKTAMDADRNLPMADLYCGVGTFALFLGELFPKIILAEENKNAISLARENSGINAEFFALRDTEWTKHLFRKISDKPQTSSQHKGEFGFIVVDPPRAGLSVKLSQALAQNGPPLLAYVSCDAASLARDAKILIGGGYKLKELKLFDFYPQTAHIESLAVFEK